jgi:hypothetical protein
MDSKKQAKNVYKELSKVFFNTKIPQILKAEPQPVVQEKKIEEDTKAPVATEIISIDELADAVNEPVLDAMLVEGEAPKETIGEAKGQYEHFNVFEDFKFITCLNEFKSTSGMRTRQGYFERLSNEFGRTLCSIRRRWERLNVLTPSQKELVNSYHERYYSSVKQRRIVFAKNCTNVSLMTIDGKSVPKAEADFFKSLKYEYLQIEPSVESEVPEPKYKPVVVPERIELVSEKQESIKESIITPPSEHVVVLVDEEEAQIIEEKEKDQEEEIQHEPEVSSSESIALDISGNEEDLQYLQKLKKKNMSTEHDIHAHRANKNQGISDCHSSISDIIEDSMDQQFNGNTVGKRRERNPDTPDGKEANGRKKQKFDQNEQLMINLKEKVENFKQSIHEVTENKDEEISILENLLGYFSSNYNCDLPTMQTLINPGETLNMEDLKFKLCMRFLSKRPSVVK